MTNSSLALFATGPSSKLCKPMQGRNRALVLVLKTGFEGRFLGNDVRGKCSVDEEGCKGMLFMIGKHMRFTVEVLQDRGMGSTRIVIKCYVTI